MNAISVHDAERSSRLVDGRVLRGHGDLDAAAGEAGGDIRNDALPGIANAEAGGAEPRGVWVAGRDADHRVCDVPRIAAQSEVALAAEHTGTICQL